MSALVLLVLQAAYFAVVVAFDVDHGSVLYLVDAAILWLGTCAVGKRLHDLGISAYRILWAAFAVIVWSVVVAAVLLYVHGDAALQPGGRAMALAAIGTSLPVFVMMIWLHLTPGMPGPNRYGIAPGDSGFCGGLPLSGTVALPVARQPDDGAVVAVVARDGVNCTRCKEAH